MVASCSGFFLYIPPYPWVSVFDETSALSSSLFSHVVVSSFLRSSADHRHRGSSVSVESVWKKVADLQDLSYSYLDTKGFSLYWPTGRAVVRGARFANPLQHPPAPFIERLRDACCIPPTLGSIASRTRVIINSFSRSHFTPAPPWHA